jgi:hypothetical protein
VLGKEIRVFRHADFFLKAVAGRENSLQKGFNKKVWENVKKALTNAGDFGILPKLSAAANAAAVSTKKNFKKIRKSA